MNTKISTQAAQGRLKIGLVLDDSLDRPDGVQQYVLALGAWLTKQGHEVRYLVGQTERADVAGVISLGKTVAVRFNGNHLRIPLPASYRNIRKVLQAEKFDVLHIQTPYSPMLAERVIKAASMTTALVGTFHILPHSRIVGWLSRVLAVAERQSLRRFHVMLAVSMAAKTFADTNFGLRCRILPNTIDLSAFLAASELPAYADIDTIVYLGRLEERKGCRYLLQAVEYLVDDLNYDKPFRVVVCGKGPELASLQGFVEARALEEYVEFAGFVSEVDKPAYLASADIAVYPSTGGESFGIVLLEGLAASRGVVLAGDNPGYASVMAPDFSGQLFVPQDILGFAALLQSYLIDPTKRHAVVADQKNKAREYDITAVGPRVLEIYREAVNVAIDATGVK